MLGTVSDSLGVPFKPTPHTRIGHTIAPTDTVSGKTQVIAKARNGGVIQLLYHGHRDREGGDDGVPVLSQRG